MKRSFFTLVPLVALAGAMMPGCLVITPVVKAGTGVAVGAGKVAGATAGKAVGTTVRTVTGGGGSSEKGNKDK